MTRRRAFTLVEAIVTMVILATVGAVTTGVVVAAGREHSSAALRADLTSRASHALERVSQTLRELDVVADDEVAAAPTLDATLISPQDIQWAGGGRLRLSAGALLLTAPGGVERTLTTGVSAFTLAPLGNTGTVLATPVTGAAIADVQRFSVTLTLTEAGMSATLRTAVFPRRLAGSPP